MNYFSNITDRSNQGANDEMNYQIKPAADPLFFFGQPMESMDDQIDPMGSFSEEYEESKKVDKTSSLVPESPKYYQGIISRTNEKKNQSKPITKTLDNIEIDRPKEKTKDQLESQKLFSFNNNEKGEEKIQKKNTITEEETKMIPPGKKAQRDQVSTVNVKDRLPSPHASIMYPNEESLSNSPRAKSDYVLPENQLKSLESPKLLRPNNENLPYSNPNKISKANKQPPTLSIGKIIVEVTSPSDDKNKKIVVQKIVQTNKEPQSRPQPYNKVYFGLNQR